MFNWVYARAKCSLAQAFEQLRLEVQDDTEKRQELRGQDHFSGKGYDHGFHCSNIGTKFSVSLSYANTKCSVTFALGKDAIEILDDTDRMLFRVTVTLNNEGRCIAKVNGQEMEFWQVRQKALESLFFDTNLPFNIPI
jgi:hypothetical protein